MQSLGQDFAGTAQDLTLGFHYTLASQLQTRSNNNPVYDWTPPTSSTSYVPDGLNRYARVSGTSHAYDGRENLTSDGVNAYTYDVENRLLTASGPTAVSLGYDPLGRLQQTQTSSGSTQYLYAGTQLVAEYDGSGLLRRYVFGPDSGDDPIVWYEGADFSQRNYLHADERESIIATSNGSGTATPYTYGPYGEPLPSWSGSRFRYTGQMAIPEADLYYYKARVYSPTLGRFLQTDPIGARDDLNLYAYAGNDPLDLADPTGNDSFVVARLLKSPLGIALVGHSFVVTNARYLGDPDARVYSYGKLANGNMGNVSNSARAAAVSFTTGKSDTSAWLNLGVRGGESNIARINAPDSTVDAVANSMKENRPYDLAPNATDTAGIDKSLIQTPGVNSNSAAFAVGDKAEQIATGNPNANVDRKSFSVILPGEGASQKIQFDFNPNTIGCGTVGVSCHSGSDLEIWQ